LRTMVAKGSQVLMPRIMVGSTTAVSLAGRSRRKSNRRMAGIFMPTALLKNLIPTGVLLIRIPATLVASSRSSIKSSDQHLYPGRRPRSAPLTAFTARWICQ